MDRFVNIVGALVGILVLLGVMPVSSLFERQRIPSSIAFFLAFVILLLLGIGIIYLLPPPRRAPRKRRR